jgi:osmotically inducible protein OsmC
MALSATLAGEGHAPDSVDVSARVHLRNVDGAPTLAQIDLEATGNVPGIDEPRFVELAEQAKAACPISRALASVPEITLSARLAG